ncbi:MAG: polyphosphate kinase 1 [Anaerostipes sp.]|nr:polyphosphate kinase 1 [Anaerostipes sp.]
MRKNYDVSFTQDRELSWLKFDERVLDQAAISTVPLFERLKFLEIFTNNLDEFFMVRVGSINEMKMIRKDHRDIRSDFTPAQQLMEIGLVVGPLYQKRDRVYADLRQELVDNGIIHKGMKNLSKNEKKYVKMYFENMIRPILSPMVVGKQHPFPHISNKDLYVGLMLKKKEKLSFGLVPVPKELDRIVVLPDKGIHFLLLEEIILYYCENIFENYEIAEKNILCITRSADINPDDEMYETSDDYRLHMKKIIKKRGRLAPVRLEFYEKAGIELIEYLKEMLQLTNANIYESQTPLDLKYVYKIADGVGKNRKKLFSYETFEPVDSPDFNQNESITKQILKGDKFLSFPFESMEPFIRLLKESSRDKETISIKITIYRLAKQAKIVKYLCEAAENGKEVLVLMELRARFDEENNINYAEILENAGCKVIYGFDEYKVHSKVCLFTKKNLKGIYYITQIGTGNYNESTSKLYTDLSLMTGSTEIGQDATKFFHNMAIFNADGDYKHLLVAPHGLKERLIENIRFETMKASHGQRAAIFMKMNSMTDRQVIDALSEASCAGVEIFLVIRGICCILPGLKGKTENIHIESIMGRFLEHSRIYVFGAEEEDMKMYISSADMMTRNTTRRVEIACPIYDEHIRHRVVRYMEKLRQDNVKARVLTSSGEYVYKHQKGYTLDSQEYYIRYAAKRKSETKTEQISIMRKFFKKFKKK